MCMARTARSQTIQTTHKLRAHRQAKGLTLETLAAAIGMSNQNLGKIERGKVPLGEEHHAPLAAALGIEPADLFREPSEAAPEGQYVPIIGRVGADNEGEIVYTSGQAAHDTAPIPPGGTAKAVALEVVGDSMPYLAPSGALVYFENQSMPPTEDMIGYYCIVETEDGRVLYKRLLRGSQRPLYSLASQVGPPIEDVRIVWAAEPTAIIPPKHAQRIIRRAGERQVA